MGESFRVGGIMVELPLWIVAFAPLVFFVLGMLFLVSLSAVQRAINDVARKIMWNRMRNSTDSPL